jgi:hypothetical protein
MRPNFRPVRYTYKISGLEPKVDEVPTVRSSDTDTGLPTVLADLSRKLTATQSIYRFKIRDFKAKT